MGLCIGPCGRSCCAGVAAENGARAAGADAGAAAAAASEQPLVPPLQGLACRGLAARGNATSRGPPQRRATRWLPARPGRPACPWALERLTPGESSGSSGSPGNREGRISTEE
eukprot:8441617-Alexandrium_andersonii.AAC.1